MMTREEKLKIIFDAKKKVKVGGEYIHYKSPDNQYLVHDVAIIEETLEPCVIYEGLYEEIRGIKWMRPISDFLAEVEKDGEVIARFRLVV